MIWEIPDGLPGAPERRHDITQVVCTKCGKPLESEDEGLNPVMRELIGGYLGNVCMGCRAVYCPDCIKVGGPTPCPTCGVPTVSAGHPELRAIGM